MKVIIAGCRDFTDYSFLSQKLDHLFSRWTSLIEVVSGCAKGADQLGERYARDQLWHIHRFPVTPADWKKYSKSAGYRRNKEMAQFADALVAFWDGRSRGTKHMIDLAREHGLRVKVVMI